MATLLIKSLGITGGLASAIATGGGIYYLTSSNPATKEDNSNKQSEVAELPPVAKEVEKNQSISDLLKGKRLLTEDSQDNVKWNAPWDLFKKAYPTETPSTPWNFENWTQENQEAEKLDSFKKQCVALGKQQVSGTDDLVFVAVEKYCTTSIAATSDTGNA